MSYDTWVELCIVLRLKNVIVATALSILMKIEKMLSLYKIYTRTFTTRLFFIIRLYWWNHLRYKLRINNRNLLFSLWREKEKLNWKHYRIWTYQSQQHAFENKMENLLFIEKMIMPTVLMDFDCICLQPFIVVQSFFIRLCVELFFDFLLYVLS